jgi:hypothetical protein
MTGLRLRATPASVLWLEPQRVVAGTQQRPLDGVPGEDRLAPILSGLPQGPTAWIVDDLWAPSVLARDVVALPSGSEAREAYFKWKLTQSLALEQPHAVQSLDLGDGTWLLTGIREDLRESWLQTALRLGRPMHSLLPRWIYLYNRLAPSREMPGMLLSLCAHSGGEFTGTLAAWGRTLTLVRQWSEPADPETWVRDRVAPTAAYLQRDSRPPQELWVWGAREWPDSGLPLHILQPEIPAQEAV